MRAQSSTVLADALRPALPLPGWLAVSTQVATGTLAIALSAQVHFHLPGNPVPVTLQTLAVLLVGAVLGSQRGAFATVAYIAAGACGLPLFSAGGMGLAKLAGPTGGYLLGFIAAAWVSGRIAESGADRRIGTALLGMLAGNTVIYLFGLPWLMLYVGIERALPLGLYPFIIGDVVKVAFAGMLIPGAWAAVKQLIPGCD